MNYTPTNFFANVNYLTPFDRSLTIYQAWADSSPCGHAGSVERSCFDQHVLPASVSVGLLRLNNYREKT